MNVNGVLTCETCGGRRPVQVKPMSPDEIHDLVERTRANTKRRRAESGRRRSRDSAAAARTKPSYQLSRVAMWLALFGRMSIARASREVGASTALTYRRWHAQFPGTDPSTIVRAMLYMRERGVSRSDAARIFGCTRSGISHAERRLAARSKQ